MTNIFLDQPEFIEKDPRVRRPEKIGYKVTPDFMLKRHEILLQPDLIKGKRILDLGSCLAATGAWCLSNGASYYKGVELYEEFARDSIHCLEKYYQKELWSIEQITIEAFLDKEGEKFDVIIASGIFYGLENPLETIRLICKKSDCVVVESFHSGTPFHSPYLSKETKQVLKQDKNIVKFIENESFLTVGTRGMVTPGDQNVRFHGFNPSMGSFKYMFSALGFEYDDDLNVRLKSAMRDIYSPIGRFGMLFRRKNDKKPKKWGVSNAVDGAENVIEYLDWKKF